MDRLMTYDLCRATCLNQGMLRVQPVAWLQKLTLGQMDSLRTDPPHPPPPIHGMALNNFGG